MDTASLTAKPIPEIYTAVGKSTIPAMMLAVRTSGDPHAVMSGVRAAIWSVHRDVPISDVRTLEQRVTQSLGRPRLLMTLLGLFAGLGVLLAAVGVYGVMAYNVNQRTHEIGIRVALGAEPVRIITGVFSGAFRQVGLGVLAGAIPGFFIITNGVEDAGGVHQAAAMLLTVAICAFVVVVAMVSCVAPLRRALRIEPTQALRTDG